MWLLLSIWLQSKSVLRVICVVVVVGWVLQIAFFAVIIISMAMRSTSLVMLVFSPIGRPLLLGVAAGLLIANLLLLLPRCARCTKPIFDGGMFGQRGQLEFRDYRASTFLNSYSMGAIMKLARTGEIRCSWCGHQVGAAPDYVVIAKE